MPSGDRTYTPERAAHVCSELAAGRSLRDICANDPGMPAEATVRLWATDDVQGFAAQYARARAEQMHAWADEIIEIADDGSNDWVDREVGRGRIERVFDREAVERSKLRIDARKWLMARVLRNVYGDKIDIKADVTVDVPARLEAGRKRVIGRE